MSRKRAWVYDDASSAGVYINLYDKGGKKRIDAGCAAFMGVDFSTGQFSVQLAASGSADAAASLSAKLTLDQSTGLLTVAAVTVSGLSTAGFVTNTSGGVLGTRALPVSSSVFQSADINTTSATLADMGAMTRTVTTQASSKLKFQFNASVENTSNFAFFAVLLDGSIITGTKRSIYLDATTGTDCISIGGEVTGLSAASHTIKVQWATGGGTLQCSPTGSPDYYGADLSVLEVLT